VRALAAPDTADLPAFPLRFKTETQLKEVTLGVKIGKEGALVGIQGCRTMEPIRFILNDETRFVSKPPLRASGNIEMAFATPKINGQENPMHFATNWQMDLSRLARLSIAQRSTLAPFGFAERFNMQLDGLDLFTAGRLHLKKDLSAGAQIFRAATEELSLDLEGAAQLNAPKESLLNLVHLEGNFDGGMHLFLEPRKQMGMRFFYNADQFGARYPDRVFDPKTDLAGLTLQGLSSHLLFEKTYQFRYQDAESASNSAGEAQGLSVAAVTPPRLPLVTRLVADQERLYPAIQDFSVVKNSLAFEAVQLNVLHLAADLGKAGLDLRLENGLPVLDRFQLNVLGGAVSGCGGFRKDQGGYRLSFNLEFTGIDMRRLMPAMADACTQEESSVDGALSFALPLDRETLANPLGAVNLRVDVTRMGGRFFERTLFALDPEGNLPTIGGILRFTRGLLALGDVRVQKFLMTLRGGKFEIEEATLATAAKNFALKDYVSLSPIPVGQLGGLKELRKKLEALAPLLEALDQITAKTIEFNAESEATLR